MNHLIGYGWRDGQPVLTWRRDPTRAPTQVREVLGPIRLGMGARRCTGFRQGRQPMPCPEQASSSQRQCLACQRRDGFRPCMICTGFDCPRLQPTVAASCRQTHHLYLASFGGPEVKVGTASDPRRTARLIDQGPLAAARIAAGPGPRIKQMEHTLSTRTDLVEGMRRSRKLSLLAGGMTESTARERVLSAIADARGLLMESYGDLLHAPDFVTLPPLALRTRERIRHQPALPIEEGVRLDGTITGAIGHVALFEDHDGSFLLDLGELAGRLVDPNPPREQRRSTVQLSLI